MNQRLRDLYEEWRLNEWVVNDDRPCKGEAERLCDRNDQIEREIAHEPATDEYERSLKVKIACDFTHPNDDDALSQLVRSLRADIHRALNAEQE
jgi:hypothetical protein